MQSALAPLKKLKHLHLGIFLSEEYLIREHIYHSDIGDDDEEETPFGPERCVICIARYAERIRQRELIAAMELSRCVKTLETVTWGSFFSKQEKERIERSTCIWVLRSNGRIRVRRCPWGSSTGEISPAIKICQ